MASSDSPFGNILDDIQNNRLDAEQKLVLAKGLLPLDPEILAVAMVFLMKDADAIISATARDTILELPLTIINNLAANRQTHPEVLDMLSRLRIGDEVVLEAIVLNPVTTDETLTYIARHCPQKIVEIVANNQERMLRHPPLIRAILDNLNTSPFIRMNLEMYVQEQKEQKKAKEEAAAMAAAIITEPARKAGGQDEGTATDRPVVKEPAKAAVKTAETKVKPAARVKDEETIKLFEEDEKLSDAGYSIQQKVQNMTVSERIKLASNGNREERMLLIREMNRLVALAALNSPKTTEDEVEQIAKMKNVMDEVLREIGNKREFLQNPIIRKNLIENPRTPIGVSLTLLKYLTEKEIGGLARNRNIPEAIRSAAHRTVQQKELRKEKKGKGH